MPRAHHTGGVSVAVPAVLTTTLLAPVVYFLLQSIPGRVEQPLAPPVPESQTATVRLLGTPQGTGPARTIAYRLKLTATDISRVVSHARIELLTTSDRANLLLGAGEIRVAGTSCVYRALSGAVFPVHDFLAFVRGRECQPLTGSATGELELTVTLSEIARLEVLAFQTPVSAPPEHRTLSVTAQGATHVFAVRGRVVDPYPARSARRIHLLNYVWQVSPSPTWIWVVIAIAGVLLLAGNILFWNGVAEGRGAVIVRTLGGAFIAAALGLFYAVLTPPFHAPDEPAHFIGFNRFMGRPEMYVEATKWAQAMHFERIQFHVLEKFGPFDIDAPGPPWNEGQAPDPNIRGGGLFHLWRAPASPASALPAPQLFAILRALNAAIFALVAGGFVLGVQRLTNANRPHLLAYPLFLLPTLPFFAMHVSNHAGLVCAYIVIGLGIIVWFFDGPRSAAAGVIIGSGWAAGLLISRSAIPLAPLIAVVLAGRLVLGGQHGAWHATLLFWAGAALPPVALMLADPEYVRTLAGFGGAAGAGSLTSVIVRSTAHPWLVLIVVGSAAAMERLLMIVRTRLSPPVRTFAERVALWLMALAALTVIVIIATSAFVSLPIMSRINPAQPPPAFGYVWSAVTSMLTMFRLRRPDFFTSLSFWGGFGWLETQPDERFVGALVLGTAASLVMLFVSIRRVRDGRMAARLLLTLAGFTLSVAAYAYTLVRLLPADLVGRYVFGAYLAMLLVCWIPLAGLPQNGMHSARGFIGSWLPPLACMGVHAFCLTLILRRYF